MVVGKIEDVSGSIARLTAACCSDAGCMMATGGLVGSTRPYEKAAIMVTLRARSPRQTETKLRRHDTEGHDHQANGKKSKVKGASK